MNPLLEIILDNHKGNYCHALEFQSIDELEIIIEEIIQQYKGRFGYTMQDLKVFKEFFYSMDLYALEGDMNRFNFKEFEEDLYQLDIGALVTEIYKEV